MLSAIVSTGPTREPINILELKSHLRITETNEDDDLLNFITAARELCEEYQNRKYVTQTIQLSLEKFPDCDYIELPYPPLASVTSFNYYDEDGNATAFEDYNIDTYSEPGRLYLKNDYTWTGDELRTGTGILITYVVGTSVANVSQRVKNAIMMLAGYMYESREAGMQKVYTSANMPYDIELLLQFDRVVGI